MRNHVTSHHMDASRPYLTDAPIGHFTCLLTVLKISEKRDKRLKEKLASSPRNFLFPPAMDNCFVCEQPPPCCRQPLLKLRACSHGGGDPQVGEVPQLGGVNNRSIQSLFFSWLLSHERWGTSPRRVARSVVPGNPLRWGKFSPCECWRWCGIMFSWGFIHYKTNWKADRTA